MRPASGPANSLPSGRPALILLVALCAAAPPPSCRGGDHGLEAEPAADSLELRLLDLDIEEARREVERLAFWRRLIPRIQLNASLGVAELAFQDAPGALVLPRDAYRLTLSLSLSEALDGGPQEKASFRLARLETERALLQLRQKENHRAEEARADAFRRKITAAEAELVHRERLARFYRMRFEQGGVEFPVAEKAALEALLLRDELRAMKARLSDPAASVDSVQELP